MQPPCGMSAAKITENISHGGCGHKGIQVIQSQRLHGQRQNGDWLMGGPRTSKGRPAPARQGPQYTNETSAWRCTYFRKRARLENMGPVYARPVMCFRLQGVVWKFLWRDWSFHCWGRERVRESGRENTDFFICVSTQRTLWGEDIFSGLRCLLLVFWGSENDS